MDQSNSRRDFIKAAGLAGLPFFVGGSAVASNVYTANDLSKQVNFITDSAIISPADYLQDLQNILLLENDLQDFYGNGGIVTALEKKFAIATGKEKAVFVPTGTLANNLAIRILSNGKVKVMVQEKSHLYRDEADAAQSIHNKRLIPLAPEKGTFTLEELEAAINYYKKGEVFKSDVGVISIENPVRRTDGEVFPIGELKKISAFCRANKYKLHLDGARLHIASAYSGISIKEYSSYFDTVYISLYKYLGSPGGAILCGDADVIDQVPPLIKVLGGSIYQNWLYAAPAFKNLDTIQDRLDQSRRKGDELIELLRKSGNFKVTVQENGSNIVFLQALKNIDYKKMTKFLGENRQVILRASAPPDRVRVFINESILNRSNREIVDALNESVKVATL